MNTISRVGGLGFLTSAAGLLGMSPSRTASRSPIPRTTPAALRLDGLSDAAAVLRALLKSDSEGVRLRSAVALLDQAVRMTELHDHEERLARLEAAAEAQKRQG